MRRIDYKAPEILPGNLLIVTRDGDETYPAMLEAIGSAKRYVHLEVYIFRADMVGRAFAAALSERARAGVEVRVLVDGVGSWSTPESFFAEMRKAGVMVGTFHPVAPWKRRWGLVRRDHRKLLVVDGRTGFTGGLNLDRCHASHSQGGGGWRDTHVQLCGPAVTELDRHFLEVWRSHGPAEHRCIDMLPYLVQAAPCGHQRVQVVANRINLHRSPIRRLYLDAIMRAKTRIWITNPYFVPDGRLVRAFVRAVKRGVDVRLLVPKWCDVTALNFAARPLFRFLTKHGVKVHLYVPRTLHAKTATIDGEWSTIGSFNLDPMSFQNLELNLVAHDRAFAATMEEHFREDLRWSHDLLPNERPAFATRVAEWGITPFKNWL